MSSEGGSHAEDMSNTVSEAALAIAMNTNFRGRRGNIRNPTGQGAEEGSEKASESPVKPNETVQPTPETPESQELVQLPMEELMRLCRQLVLRIADSPQTTPEALLRRYDTLVKIQDTAAKMRDGLSALD